MYIYIYIYIKNIYYFDRRDTRIRTMGLNEQLGTTECQASKDQACKQAYYVMGVMHPYVPALFH